MALPPFLPVDQDKGNAFIGAQQFLGFRRADKTDGHADHRGGPWRAGVEHFEQSKQRRRRIAYGHDGAVQSIAPKLQSGGAARIAGFPGETGDARVGEHADHLVVRGQTRARDAMRDHVGVAQDWRAGAQRHARRLGRAGREDDVVGDLDHAAGVDDAHGDALLRRRKARKPRLGANGREGARVDRGAVANIVYPLGHDASVIPFRATTSAISASVKPVAAGASLAAPL